MSNPRTAIIVHGICDENEYYRMDSPSPSNAHWLPWLQQKFLRQGILCQAPEMPRPYAPLYEDWATVFSAIAPHGATVCVGHSAGGGFLLKWLQQNPNARFDKIILVAPWLDPARRLGDFLHCKLESRLQDRVGEIHVFFSSDEKVPGVAVTKDTILNTFTQARLHPFADKGHFFFSDTGLHFNELWEVCAA